MIPNRDLLSSPFTLEEIESARDLVQKSIKPTPQISWPLLSERTGCEVFVKHENHLPTGAFKVRGGVFLLNHLSTLGSLNGLIVATRGNHGQSIAYAGRKAGIPVHIVVPEDNNRDKNRAMRALGANLIVSGEDFNEAMDFAIQHARKLGLLFVPSYHALLVQGVATYAYELLTSVRNLAAVYVPIGLGSGIAGMIAVRDALKLETEIIGVVAKNANTYRLSFDAGKAITTDSASTLADGLAVRKPDNDALQYILRGAARVVEVSEQDLNLAIKAIFLDTHNVSEGAGAASLAGLMKEKDRQMGKRVSIILSGGNVDTLTLMSALSFNF